MGQGAPSPSEAQALATSVQRPASSAASGMMLRMAIRPFRIDVPQSVLDDLRSRLEATRWVEPIPGTGWDYGADPAYVRELCEYWQTAFDWRAREQELNAHPGFLCEVDGVDLHFWHVRGERAGVPAAAHPWLARLDVRVPRN